MQSLKQNKSINVKLNASMCVYVPGKPPLFEFMHVLCTNLQYGIGFMRATYL